MAIPPQFEKKDGGGDATPKIGVGQALGALEDHAKSPRARAALNTLRSELQEGDNSSSKPRPGNTNDAKKAALARLGA